MLIPGIPQAILSQIIGLHRQSRFAVSSNNIYLIASYFIHNDKNGDFEFGATGYVTKMKNTPVSPKGVYPQLS